jgi:integrase
MANLKAGFRDYCLFELGRRESTVKTYLERLDAWERWTGKPIELVGADDARELKRQRPWKGETIKGMIVTLRQFRKWARLEGVIEDDGRIDDVRPCGPYDDAVETPPLSIEKARILLDACRRPLEFRLVYYGLYAGTRIGESAIIDGTMWQDGWLRFPAEKRRGLREVPIHPELDKVRFQMWASLPTDKSNLQRVKRRLAKRIGFDFVAHQLRKTWSTALYDEDVPDRIVKSLLGHAQDVTGRYVEVSRRRKLEAITRLSYAVVPLAGLSDLYGSHCS